jgi:hypothetical protein
MRHHGIGRSSILCLGGCIQTGSGIACTCARGGGTCSKQTPASSRTFALDLIVEFPRMIYGQLFSVGSHHELHEVFASYAVPSLMQ